LVAESCERFLPRALEAEELLDAVLVVSDDHFIADVDDGHTHLAAFFYHFFSLLEVGRDIEITKATLLAVKKSFAMWQKWHVGVE